ncbi:helix-turn-helix domain-containing protein [Parahaliea maris]|uniref:helix-turn-helix domain-containing protein n=1 Tax=Parahaliea maris TaxID=2716870 RepID=UPI00164F8BAD|nr:helix-turn-helix domain-containing protein [Parahaliea maris]
MTLLANPEATPHCSGRALLLGILITWATTVAATDGHQPEPAPEHWPEVLTLDQAARYLQLDPASLGLLALEDGIPARRVGNDWRFSRQALQAWLAGDWHLIASAERFDGEPPLTTTALASVRGAGTGRTAEDAGELASERSPEHIGEAPQERSAGDIFLRGQRVLLRPGDVTLDFGSFYSQSSAQQLVQIDDGIALADLESEGLTGLLLARYGLFEETEIFLSTSWSDQDTKLRVADQTIASDNRSELGDFRLGLRRTLLTETVGRPDIILTLNGRIPSDSDHSSYALGAGLGVVKSIDPVVLFANLHYRHTYSDDFEDITRLEPENRLDLNLGYAFAINDTLSLNTTLSGLFIDETRFDNATLLSDELFSLQFSMTSWLAEGLYIEPAVGFRLNGPGKGFFIGMTLPYTFEP